MTARPVTARPATVLPPVLAAGEQVLPGYRVEGLLARGGRVDTYDATSLERDCRAVVKVVRPDRAEESRVRDALLLEGELLTTLSHPHLVRGYEVVDSPVAAVVLETIPGVTLDGLLLDGPLGPADTVLLGRQLVSVLGYLHRHGWLHLDVKPDNVVVQEGRAVLIDLGLATRPGPIRRGLGTVGYAAPEQDRAGAVSTASDVWGLGATLFECATGRVPGRRPDLGRVHAALRPLLADCLRPRPDRRPTLDEVRDRLELLLDAPPVRSRRPWRRTPPRTPGAGPGYRDQRAVASGTPVAAR